MKKKGLALVAFILLFPSVIYIVLTVDKERTFALLPYYGPKKPIQLNVNSKIKKDTVYYHVPFFSFHDQDNKVVNSDMLKGRIWVACFCHLEDKTITPGMAVLMNRVEERTNLDTTIRLITFTLDSESTKSMHDYINMVHAGSKHLFITGNAAELNSFATEGFYQPTGTSTTGLNYFFLIDREGCIRGIYNGKLIKETDKLINDISEQEAHDIIKNEKKAEKERDKDEAI